jgi:hypothetical protein
VKGKREVGNYLNFFERKGKIEASADVAVGRRYRPIVIHTHKGKEGEREEREERTGRRHPAVLVTICTTSNKQRTTNNDINNVLGWTQEEYTFRAMSKTRMCDMYNYSVLPRERRGNSRR